VPSVPKALLFQSSELKRSVTIFRVIQDEVMKLRNGYHATSNGLRLIQAQAQQGQSNKALSNAVAFIQ
jgi:hypothetical protein